MTYGLRIRSARERGAAQQPENGADWARSVGHKRRRARKRHRKNALEVCEHAADVCEGRPYYRVFSEFDLPFWASRDWQYNELGRSYGGAVQYAWARSVGRL